MNDINADGNSLVEEAAAEQEKIKKYEPGIKEANLTFFAIMVATALTFPLMLALNGKIAVDGCIALAVISIVLAIPFSVAGHKLTKNKPVKPLFYIAYLLNALSIMFSTLAIVVHYGITLTTGKAFLAAGVFIVIAVLELAVLSNGKRERLTFSLMSLLFIGTAIWGGLSSDGMTAPLLMYSGIMLLLHLSMLIYVFSGEAFFVFMSAVYVSLAAIALVIALAVISDGSCDCGGCDCGIEGGGRRNKAKK